DREKKIQFLEKKGLTKEEIEEAFKKTDNVVTPSDAEKPNVPTRQPYQVVYYSTEATPIRMTIQQLMKCALIVGLSSVGIVSILLRVVKQYMSKVFGSIAKYQSSRYKDRIQLLKRLEGKLKEQDTDYTGLIKEQSNLSDRLSQLTSLIRVKQHTGHSALKTAVDSLHYAFTNLPQGGYYSYGGGIGGFVPSYASRTGGEDPDVQSLKSEIRSFKGTLLSRRNFPTITTSQWTRPEAQQTPSSQADIYHPRRRRSFRSELPSGFEGKS
ncbi:hypothetical protein CU098_010281, partial [Rhizopus stolonifer]